MANMKIVQLSGSSGGAGRSKGLQSTGFLGGPYTTAGIGFAQSYALAASATVATDPIDASGYVTFRMMVDVVTVSVLFSIKHVHPDTGALLPKDDMTSLPAGVDQNISFGFRGAFLDDHIFGTFALFFTNLSSTTAGSVQNLRLWASSL